MLRGKAHRGQSAQEMSGSGREKELLGVLGVEGWVGGGPERESLRSGWALFRMQDSRRSQQKGRQTLEIREKWQQRRQSMGGRVWKVQGTESLFPGLLPIPWPGCFHLERHLQPCSSKSVLRPEAWASPGHWLADSPHPDLPNHDLHVNKSAGDAQSSLRHADLKRWLWT